MRRTEQDQGRLAQALMVRLDLEHEAVWLLGVVGGSVASLQDRATKSFTRHRRSRDSLIVTLRRLGVEPTAARASYGEPPVGEQDCRAAVADVERRLVAACLDLVNVSGPRGRPRAVDALRRSALEVIAWGGSPEAFPGLA
ncbi:DUF4439 domain-containing protein [Aeromicrobium sp. CTD01-1L150]|uniref:DUF4439 domain-containing protein n=1 Tax=Aeromicrobium sp. CTD01-1L150 TaxID=3341830 RepID=UPI0035C09997